MDPALAFGIQPILEPVDMRGFDLTTRRKVGRFRRQKGEENAYCVGIGHHSRTRAKRTADLGQSTNGLGGVNRQRPRPQVGEIELGGPA